MKATDEAIAAYIARYRLERGYSPSIRDVARRFGYKSPASVLHRLRRMRDKGLVDFEDGVQRTLRLGGGDGD